MSIGQKILEFENALEQTVKTFNELFVECKIPSYIEKEDKKLLVLTSDEVEIGEIIGPDLVRKVYVNGVEVRHIFVPEFLMPLDIPEEVMNGAKNNRNIFMRKENTLMTNEDLENTVMSDEEMKLDPMEYVLLQYLRGCQSPYHTQIEMADKLNKSRRGLRNVIRRLEEKNIIETKNIVNHHRIYIKINEEWA